MKTPHTSAPSGKKIFVRLKTGERFVDTFLGRKGILVIFKNRTVKQGDIKAFSIFRQKEGEDK